MLKLVLLSSLASVAHALVVQPVVPAAERWPEATSAQEHTLVAPRHLSTSLSPAQSAIFPPGASIVERVPSSQLLSAKGGLGFGKEFSGYKDRSGPAELTPDDKTLLSAPKEAEATPAPPPPPKMEIDLSSMLDEVDSQKKAMQQKSEKVREELQRRLAEQEVRHTQCRGEKSAVRKTALSRVPRALRVNGCLDGMTRVGQSVPLRITDDCTPSLPTRTHTHMLPNAHTHACCLTHTHTCCLTHTHTHVASPRRKRRTLSSS